ncbi:MAG TPA: carboxypeptidase regulatory-like domain-containing protein [Ktedonobacteraceae bacterium]
MVAMSFEPSESLGPVTEISTLVADGAGSSSDQVLSRLNAAARSIAAEEPGESRLKRSSRLRPLRDISADIQRGSTPHPRLQRPSAGFDTIPGSGAGRLDRSAHNASSLPNSGAGLPPSRHANGHTAGAAGWPWFGDDGEEEKESDVWADLTDPLLARSRPIVGEAASIEEADMRRVQLEEQTTQPLLLLKIRRRRFSRWHLAFVSMVLLALIALTIDGSLLSFAFRRASHSSTTRSGPPALLLSTNLANPGGMVSVHLTHFPALTRAVLTHDVQEALLTSNNRSTLEVDANGSASATFSVDTTWGPGFHLIVAEDVKTRDTASATLQIAGEGPSRPPHLLVDNTSLDLGDAVQGADTIQPLELRNSGSGSITWSASSDQPWLLVAPVRGVFSAGQSLSVAVQRSNLKPGPHEGTITIFSTVGAPQTVKVSMNVSALPPNAGPMIALAPPLLSFTATDGSTAPQTQVVTLSNPGQQELSWSLKIGSTSTTTMLGPDATQSTANPTLLASWLNADLRSGKLAPGRSIRIRLTVTGRDLLPGSYMVPLTFSSSRAFDNPQVMDVALTVQPRCGLLTSTGVLDFTAVVGQNNPSNHALGLSTTSSCGNDTLNWNAFSSQPWLTVSPQSGQLKGANDGVTSIGVNTANLKADRYTGLVTFQAGKSTQTVVVNLNLQPHPAAYEPILGASPLSLNFSTIQGQSNPAGQVVTITNNGGSVLKWHISVVQLGTNWLSALSSGGDVPPGQTGQVTINVDTSGLTPGTYTGQVLLAGTDSRGAPASGSPQAISINLTVQPPCTLAQPSPSALLFTATAGGGNPLAQTVNLTSGGSCAWPVHWSASIVSPASWLTLSASSGSLASLAQQGAITVGANIGGLQPGTYTTQVRISALDSAGMMASNSPQSFSITLVVQKPCTLVVPDQITLTAQAGQTAAAARSFTLAATGSCDSGVTWTASGDANSSSWLALSATSGIDNGSGSAITVGASASQLVPGTYVGQITISANNNGMVLQGSPQTIKVIFQVSGYTVSGTAQACSDPSCTTSQGLGGATVSLINSGGNTIETVTADNSGNFTLTNVPPGTYTISASGPLNGNAYSGTVTVTVNSSTDGTGVQTFSS